MKTEAMYRVWGTDKVIYGPLDMPTLIQWVQGERLTRESWVLVEDNNQWQRATEVPELKARFAAKSSTGAGVSAKTGADLSAGSLRRTKLFAGLEEAQLASLAHYLEVIRFPQFSHIVRQGQHGDAMYVVTEGEVRVLTIVDNKESILATLVAGDCFGEISLLDQGPRSADVIANKDSVLLRISNASFDRLVREAPALAVPFLLALSRAVVQRVRRTNLKYEDSIRFIRASTAKR